MNSWKIILATVVIFGAGVVTGGLLVNYVADTHRPHRPPDSTQRPQETREHAEPRLQEPPLANRLGKQFLKQLDDKLQLTPEQREKIAKIVAEGQEHNHELWTNVAPKMRAVMSEVNQQIREQLTPEQLKKFEELLNQFRPPRRPPNATNAPPVLPPTNSPPAASTNVPGV